MGTTHHPSTFVAEVLEFARGAGWTLERHEHSAAWGTLACPARGCSVAVWAAPAHQGDHALRLLAAIILCPHDVDTAQT